jgi:hypothetical protein
MHRSHVIKHFCIDLFPKLVKIAYKNGLVNYILNFDFHLICMTACCRFHFVKVAYQK